MIGIMADSHDNLIAIRKAVEIFNQLSCSLVIHAGDIVAPFSAQELKNLHCPVKAIFGNCDGEKEGLSKVFREMNIGEISPAPQMFTFEGLVFWLSHYPVEQPEKKGADVVIFGHTHRSQVNRNGNFLMVNPGETGGWVKGVSTVAVLDPKTLVVDVIIL
ncbi:MAG: metallophosphoesterase [Candidatus Aminicenantes bacterium]|nr:metallophosphoesterase [Candidatus Aminicenantes bacterium]